MTKAEEERYKREVGWWLLPNNSKPDECDRVRQEERLREAKRKEENP